jgi:signal transduction histidine kinase
MFSKIQDVNQESDESLDLLMQSWVRLLLSSACLLVFFLDPVESGLHNKITHILLVIFSLYSVCFVVLYDTRIIREFAASRAAYWIDTLFFSCLIALTGGSESIFFPFFFFPILVASFSCGFIEGIKITIASAVLCTLVGLVFSSPHGDYDLGEAIIRPIYLVVFGYVIAHWGNGRIVLKRRLNLLQEISTNWSPRFGANHAIMRNLGRLVEFYQGSRCIIVMDRAEFTPRYLMYVADAHKPITSEAPHEIADTTAKELLALPDLLAVAFNRNNAHGVKFFNKYLAYDINTFESTDKYFSVCSTLSNLFDDESFISAPYRQQDVTSGRIYLVAGSRTFNRSDVAFIKQAADVLSSVVENMQLIENLVEEAGVQERHKISLDVHDTTIQPYIGLTLALDALSREFKSNIQLTGKIAEIINMANMTVQDLRSYKDTLQEKSMMRGDLLLSAVQHHVDRLLRFYGIHVEVKGMVDPRLTGQKAEAAFQIIKEGLSNILRHTKAKSAFVSIQNTETHLLLEIGNETNNAPAKFQGFKPKSIYERVLSLNGETLVENQPNGYTVVRVSIPLNRD